VRCFYGIRALKTQFIDSSRALSIVMEHSGDLNFAILMDDEFLEPVIPFGCFSVVQMLKK
jgi:hypothetical protein